MNAIVDSEIPKYRSPIALLPAALARYHFEPPFEDSLGGDSSWQYGTKPIAAGEIVSTWDWPHPRFQPLNETAKKIHSFFSREIRSRLTRAPFFNGKLSLETGLSGHPVTSEILMPRKAEPNLTPAGR